MSRLYSNWILHLVGLSAVILVCRHGFNSQKQWAAVKEDIGMEQRLALPVIKQLNRTKWNDIVQDALAYPLPQNLIISERSSTARALVADFGIRSTALIDRLGSGIPVKDIDWQSELVSRYWSLGDSLALYSGNKMAVRLDSCMFNAGRNQMKTILGSLFSRKDTTVATSVCRNLNLRAELALKMLLDQHRNSMRIYDEMNYDTVLPVITPKECPRVGKVFVADVYLAPYFTDSKNCKAMINGRTIPTENGVVKIEKLLTYSGAHSFNVNVNVRNPLTGEIKSYNKEFEIYAAPTPQ